MRLIRVAAACVNQTPLAWDANLANLLGAIDAARNAGVSLLCLPELAIPGYGCEDAFLGSGTIEESWRSLERLLPSTRGMIVSVGLPVMHDNALFNCAAVICDGRVIAFVAKQHLAGDGIHYEPRWFKPWPQGVRSYVTAPDGANYPIGDLHVRAGGIGIGFEICEDAWVASRPGSRLAQKAIDVILNPSASHFAFGKLETRKRFVIEGSRAFGVTYVYSNLLGNEAGRAIYDGGALIATSGKLLAEGSRFSFADYEVTTAVVDVDATRHMQASTASFVPSLVHEEGERVEFSFAWPEVEFEVAPPLGEALSKEQEFEYAETLALFDYMRKSHSHGFVVSLSGGADSAAVAVLVALMFERAKEKLGIADLRELLTCVYQSTANSSSATRDAARAVAEGIGATFIELDVDPLVSAYRGLIENAIGRELTWETDDIALQNLQARVRAPGVWMLANVRNALLLATSNRSEAAVGYATMDGDTCGGLSPIAGIDKAFLRQWLASMESRVPSLAAVNRLAPTAELRPADRHQTDEDDLMPYPVLDAIERAAIRDKRPPAEVYRVMRAMFPQYTAAQMVEWVRRFFLLWSRNQWKRERYAPSFHLDDENLDPKTWCRFPILSGGFEKELSVILSRADGEGSASGDGSFGVCAPQDDNPS